jgi:hypothetical protein
VARPAIAMAAAKIAMASAKIAMARWDRATLQS